MVGFFYGLAGFLFLNSVGMIGVATYQTYRNGASDGELKALGQMSVALMVLAVFVFIATIFGNWMGGTAC